MAKIDKSMCFAQSTKGNVTKRTIFQKCNHLLNYKSFMG